MPCVPAEDRIDDKPIPPPEQKTESLMRALMGVYGGRG
jgi:hypothetical protein